MKWRPFYEQATVIKIIDLTMSVSSLYTGVIGLKYSEKRDTSKKPLINGSFRECSSAHTLEVVSFARVSCTVSIVSDLAMFVCQGLSLTSARKYGW
jgi:hypothetical protein